MKKLMYILLFLLFAANLAAQENYVIDSVCVGTSEIYKIGTTFKGSTWEWYLKDSLGNEIAKPAGTDFWEEISPGDTLWESRINIIWDSTGIFELSVLHYSEHGCDTLEQGRIKVFPLPNAYAGNDMIVCVTNGFTLTTDTAANYSSVLWTTLGDGTFDDASQLNPTYTPGLNDSITGSVILVLTVNGLSGNGTCIPAKDTMEILFGNPIIKLNSHNLICYNDNTGSVKVTVTGGIAPYIYSWTGPGSYAATSDSIFGLAAGKYAVTVTDNIGCVVAGSVEVTQPGELIADITADKGTICFGDIINFSGKQTGGTLDYTQLWSGSGAAYLSAVDIVAPAFENAPAGLYELIYTVTDANGCVAADTLPVAVNPVYHDTISLTVCEDLLPYNWQGQILDKEGFYSDRLSSVNGCDSIIYLNFEVEPLPVLVLHDQEACEPDVVDLTDSLVFAGSSPNLKFTYWMEKEMLTAIPKPEEIAVSGTYYIRAENANGCSVTKPAVVTIHTPPSVPVLAVTNPTCETETGTLEITSPLGTDITFSIDGILFQAETKFENLDPGDYTVTAKNSAGCFSSAGETIGPVLQVPEIPILTVTQPDCDIPTGTIEVTSPVGSELTYSIDGSNFQPGTKFENLKPGEYTVMAKNSDGCISSAVETVAPALNVPEKPILTVTQPDCDIPTGTIDVTSPVGAGLTYSIDGALFQIETKFEKLTPGDYTVTVKNSDGCINSADEKITPTANTPEIPVLAVTQPDCDIPAGTIEVKSPVGAEFTYSIDGTNFQIETKFENLATGKYTVTVKNSDGCINSADESVNPALNVPEVPILTATQPDCDITTGTIEVTSPVGEGLTYSIDGTIFQIETKFEKLTSGDYTVTVKNSDGCISSANGTIDPAIEIPEKPVLTVTQPDCDIPTGTIEVTTPVGEGLTYSIDGAGFQTETKFEKLTPGDYTVTVKNSAGCINSADETINPALNVPEAPVLTATQPDCDIPTGTIEVISPVGTGLTYSIDGINYQTETKFEKLTSGDYTVTVKNSDGCISSAIGTIDPAIDIPEKPVLTVTQPDCDIPTGTIEVTTPVGEGLTYSIDGTNFQIETNFEKLEPGNYTISVKNSIGCINSTPETINPALNVPEIPVLATVQPDCDIPTGTIEVISPVGEGLTYSIDGTIFQIETKFEKLTSGDYTVTVKNSDGCISLANGTIDPFTGISEKPVLAVTQPDCDIPTGTIEVISPVGEGLTYSIDGTNFQAETKFENMDPGDYTVTVKNSDGCINSADESIDAAPLQLAVSLTIIADREELTEGETVIFTATPVNGGVVPVYAWFVNGTEVSGKTSDTYAYAPKNEDVVYAVLTSSDTACLVNNPATSNKITIKVNAILPVSVTITADQENICEGGSVTFTATPVNGGANPVYAWFVNTKEVLGATSASYSYSPQNGDVVYTVMTSSLTNVTGNPATSNEIEISIRKDLPVIVTIFADNEEICEGKTVTFRAMPFNGGSNPVYAWFVHGVEITGETSATFTYIPKNNDLVHARLTSNLSCAFGNPAISNKVQLKVYDNATVSVTIDADKTDICESESVTFTALPSNGGANPVYAWFVNKIEVPGETLGTFTYKPNDKDAVYAVLTSGLLCTTDPAAFSNIKRINVAGGNPVSVSVIAGKTEICEGEMVTYKATALNEGVNPAYTWFVNNVAVPGETTSVFTYPPQKGDEVYVRLTSDVQCALDNPANSNKTTVVVNEKLPVSVSLVADKNFICDGMTVIFTATPVNGGTNPVFTWYVNNIAVPGATSNTHTYQPKNGDVVYALLTSDLNCISGNPAISDKITITITGELPVSVSVEADKKVICDGEKVTYTATPVNGGTNPVYEWFVNGAAIPGETKAIYAYSPKKGDEVYAVVNSDLGCVSDNPASSNKITVHVIDLLLAGVSVTADKTEICEGERITFTATPTNGGDNPHYEWFVNGTAIAGETDMIFKYKPKDGDEIFVKLTSGETCILDPVALSDTIKVTYSDGLLVKVDIAADKTTICIDETVTFTATPENGGDNPVFAWFVNGAKITGQTGMTFAYKPKDGDEVYVQLTSGSACVVDPVALSDTITITVTDGLLVKVDIAADKTEMCEGETVTFTATHENGGDNPVYVWFVNGLIRTGETKDVFSYQPKNGDKVYVKLTSGETCVIDPVALSNTIIINVSGELVVSVKLPPQILVCENEPVTVTATTVNGGINPVYTWFLNNVEIKDETSETYTYTPNDKDEIFVTVESDITCTKDNTVTSNAVIISVGDILPPEAICRNITVYLDADGKASITAAQINNESKDNCKMDTLFLSRYDFDCADVGKNPVTLTAVDAVGLSDFCEATVTVLDTISPLAKCKAPFSIQLDQNAEYTITIDQINAESSDNCGIDTLYLDIYNLTCDHIGLTPITLTAVDVNGNKSQCFSSVTIFGNIAPTIVDDNANTMENEPVVIDVIDNDFDEKTSIDISTLSISIKPLHGTVTINPVNGDLTYTPNKNFSGVDVLQYRICDDGIPCEPECGKAFVYITVHAVNEPPVTSDDFFSTGCISISRNVLDNDLDQNTDNLIINTIPVTPPIHGTVIIDPDGTINYFPNEGFIGIDSFEYVICDNGFPVLCDTAKVYIKVDCNEINPNPLDCELYIPEGFSPNSDGILDFFRIWCIEHYPNAKLMIFNRNGDLLWQKQNYGNYDVWGDQYNAWWWGTSVTSKYDVGRQMINGEPKLKVGNYIYVLDLGNGGIKNGTVMISY
jgi:gliding motility-associated-like protein